MTALSQTDLPLPSRRSGKVRDLYTLPATEERPERLLLVATDRLSAFDVVLPTPIPGKGALLTAMSKDWMSWVESEGICRTQLTGETLAQAAPDLPADLARELEPRCVVATKTSVVPVECVVRGYLEGSGWKDYQKTGSVCGVDLPAGFRQCDQLPEPVFTPATKAELGEHDENISFERACEIAGQGVMERLRELSLTIYTRAAERARARGVIIADTKFEFGLLPGESGPDGLILIDEALTPDSSRFWPAEDYDPGHAQPSFDKQFVREHLEALVARGEWDKTAPGPQLPDETVNATIQRYEEAYTRLFA